MVHDKHIVITASRSTTSTLKDSLGSEHCASIVEDNSCPRVLTDAAVDDRRIFGSVLVTTKTQICAMRVSLGDVVTCASPLLLSSLRPVLNAVEPVDGDPKPETMPRTFRIPTVQPRTKYTCPTGLPNPPVGRLKPDIKTNAGEAKHARFVLSPEKVNSDSSVGKRRFLSHNATRPVLPALERLRNSSSGPRSPVVDASELASVRLRSISAAPPSKQELSRSVSASPGSPVSASLPPIPRLVRTQSDMKPSARPATPPKPVMPARPRSVSAAPGGSLLARSRSVSVSPTPVVRPRSLVGVPAPPRLLRSVSAAPPLPTTKPPIARAEFQRSRSCRPPRPHCSSAPRSRSISAAPPTQSQLRRSNSAAPPGAPSKKLVEFPVGQQQKSSLLTTNFTQVGPKTPPFVVSLGPLAEFPPLRRSFSEMRPVSYTPPVRTSLTKDDAPVVSFPLPDLKNPFEVVLTPPTPPPERLKFSPTNHLIDLAAAGGESTVTASNDSNNFDEDFEDDFDDDFDEDFEDDLDDSDKIDSAVSRPQAGSPTSPTSSRLSQCSSLTSSMSSNLSGLITQQPRGMEYFPHAVPISQVQSPKPLSEATVNVMKLRAKIEEAQQELTRLEGKIFNKIRVRPVKSRLATLEAELSRAYVRLGQEED